MSKIDQSIFELCQRKEKVSRSRKSKFALPEALSLTTAPRGYVTEASIARRLTCYPKHFFSAYNCSCLGQVV